MIYIPGLTAMMVAHSQSVGDHVGQTHAREKVVTESADGGKQKSRIKPYTTLVV